MERTLDDEESSISDSEKLLPSSSSKRKYPQKFRINWYNDPRLSNWIVEVGDQQAKCDYCSCKLKCKLSSLLRHMESSKHIAAASVWETNHQKTIKLHPDPLETTTSIKLKNGEVGKTNTLQKPKIYIKRSRPLEEEGYSSSDAEDLLLSGANKRKYPQKFRKSWFNDPRLSNWIVEVSDNQAKCKYCRRGLKCKLSSLLRHAETTKHISATSVWKSNHQNDFDETAEYLDEEEYSSSDTKDDISLPSTSKRKFGKSWMVDPRLAEWIIEINDEKVKCKYCDCVIRAKLYNLLKHRKTSKHIASVSPTNDNSQETLESRSYSMSPLNRDLSKPTCRVCLQNNDEEMMSIFDMDEDINDLYIYEKIEQCAGIKVLRHGKMPTLICADCFGFLKVSYKFRTICRNSNEYLKEFVVLEEQDKKIEIPIKQNPLFISENENQTDVACSQYQTRLEERSNSHVQDVKNEDISPSNTPKIDEEFVEENFGDDCDEMWLNIAYNDDDDISCENLEQIDVGVKEEDSQIIKAVKREKKPKKEKKPRIIASKTLDISADGAAIIRDIPKKASVKRAKREKQPHICDVCGNIYQRLYSLELHMRRHGTEKPYECEICGYAFHSNFELIRHLRKHTGSRPYKCSYCARAFGDHSTLIKHERIHRNERPFKCDTCGKCFTYSNVLKYHKYVHTGEKPYSCELCGKCFTRPHHLRAHLETLQHQSDPRSKILIQNIRKNNEDETRINTTSTLKI